MGPPLAVGGVGAAVSFEDVARIARGDGVTLDVAARERLKKDSPAKSATLDFSDASAEPRSYTEWLSKPQARAALLARLLPIVNGRSKVRLGVVELLVRLLQQDAPLAQLLPAATADRDVLQSLATALPRQAGSAAGELSSAEAAVVDTGLSADERAVLQTGQPIAAGIAAVAIADARELLTAAAAVTSLSAEALQADVSSWTPCMHLCIESMVAYLVGANGLADTSASTHSLMTAPT